jgi:hypothetical protein
VSGPARNLRVPPAAATASPLLRAVTWGVPVVLIAATFVPDKEATPATQAGLRILALVLLAWFQLAPRRLAYTLTPDAVVIQRILNQTRLPYAGLGARRTSGVLAFRTFGTGLPGYLTGHFTLAHDERGVGRVRAAASRGRGGVLLHSGDADYFLTPADPTAFLAELARRGARVIP